MRHEGKLARMDSGAPKREGEITLEIHRTWAGESICDAEWASVSLRPRTDGLRVSIDAPWYGDPAPRGRPGRHPTLWEHEVVELFIVGEGRRYVEIEVGPHGHWLALRHRDVRVREAEFDVSGLHVQRAAGGTRWRAHFDLDLAVLPLSTDAHGFNAYSIHGQGAQRRFLAHAPVPGDVPDFHRIDMFPRAVLSHPRR